MVINPRIVLGTVQLGMPYGINNTLGKPSFEQAIKLLLVAKSVGITTLDSSEKYGDAHQVIAAYHELHPLDKFEVITKFSLAGRTNFSVRRFIQLSIRELRVNKLKACLFHTPSDMQSKGVVEELIACKQDGLVDDIGVSIYTKAEMQQAIACDWVTLIQFPFNLLDNWSQRGSAIELACKKGVKLHARSALLQGLFAMDIQAVPEKLNQLTPYLIQLKAIAQKTGMLLPELAYSYVYAKEQLHSIVIGVDSVEQLTQNLNFLNKQLNPELVREIDNIKVDCEDLLYPYNWQ